MTRQAAPARGSATGFRVSAPNVVHTGAHTWVQAGDGDPIAELPVSAVMRRDVPAIAPGQTLSTAAGLMRRTGCHHLPVVRDDGRCIAVLDELTVARRLRADSGATIVADVLERRPRAGVRPEAPVSAAARGILLNGTGAVPVVDRHGALVGLLTAGDLLAAIGGRSGQSDRTAR